jgi:predicted nicotinamide N-methyase
VLAADIDSFAATAIALNAAANGVTVAATTDDLIDSQTRADVIVVGDMCYERPLAERLLNWLWARIAGGATVLLGDPGRSYFPKGDARLERLGTYGVQTTRELEDREIRETSVYRLTP